MGWPLRHVGKDAEDIAAALSVFKEYCPEFETDISDCIGNLFHMKASLGQIDNSLDYVTHTSTNRRVQADLDIVIPTFQYTAGACRNIFKDTPAAGYLRSSYEYEETYRGLWLALQTELVKEGTNLLGRLVFYSSFLRGISDTCKGEEATLVDMEYHRGRLSRLLRKQEPVRDDSTGPYYVQTGRPSHHHYHPPPPPPQPAPPSRRPISFSYVPASYPPPAPEAPPLSPTFSSDSSQSFSTTQTFGTGSGSSISEPKHWAKRIMDGNYPVSALRMMPNRRTECLGRNDPGALDTLQREGFFVVLDIPFEESTARVMLYWRPTDHRARILYSENHYRAQQICCMPITALKIIRDKSTLKICRVNRDDGGLDIWATLKFTSYERMALFYCTAVAMKMQDWQDYHPTLQDILHPAEMLEFGGEIRDDEYLHGLRILRDVDSGALRLEATRTSSSLAPRLNQSIDRDLDLARRGRMKSCPIWTAFIPPNTDRRRWAKRVAANVVVLRKLHPYVFSDAYTPRKNLAGEFELRFTQPDDATSFLGVCKNFLG